MFSEQEKGFGCATMSAAVLATTGICIRYLTEVHAMEPLVLAFWRNSILVVVLLCILECFYPVLVEIKKSDLSKLIIHGGVLALFNYFWTYSVAINGAAVATFLVYSSVAFAALLGKITLGESLGGCKTISVLLTLTGCLLVSGSTNTDLIACSNPGLITGLCSGFCFALYSLCGKSARNNKLNSWTILLYSFAFAALFLFVVKIVILLLNDEISTLVPTFFSLGTTLSGWVVLMILAIGPTMIGFGLYTVSLGYLSSSVVNIIATTELPLAAVLAFLILDEKLSGYQICGSALIIIAILVLKTATTSKKMAYTEKSLQKTV